MRIALACLGVFAALVVGTLAIARPGAQPTATTPEPAATQARAAAAAPDPLDVYAFDRPGMLSPAVANVAERVYVPNSRSDTVSVIDPRSFKVVDTFPAAKLPQHVTPSYDLRTLWVGNDYGNSVTPIDPVTAKPGPPIPVADPYNMYFTPDGSFAIVVAEALRRLDFRDPHTMALRHSLEVPCPGVDHLDFFADGRYLIASCEFANRLIKVDVQSQQLVDTLVLRPGSEPQDVKLSPDGRVFYVADKTRGGVHLIDAASFREVGFVGTGSDAHGLYVSRDSRYLYVSNRGSGSVSVIAFDTQRVVTTWTLPGGGTPDMGGISSDGRLLWLSGRYSSEVYAIDTQTGSLVARIPVGLEPHGLAVFPQPGRYSLGHTGVFR